MGDDGFAETETTGVPCNNDRAHESELAVIFDAATRDGRRWIHSYEEIGQVLRNADRRQFVGFEQCPYRGEVGCNCYRRCMMQVLCASESQQPEEFHRDAEHSTACEWAARR